MKNIVLPLFLSLLFTSCQAQIKPSALPANEFELAISNADVQVLDVRTAAEYNSGHLSKSLQADWYNRKQFIERTASLDKSKPVYVYCLTGIRSSAAAKQLMQNGFATIKDLKGGLTAWKLAGKPVEGAAKVKQITPEEYNTQINVKKTVLVDFGAVWCPPCKKMEPVITRLKNEAAENYNVLNIDAATQTALMKNMNIEALPVFIVYKNGKVVWRKQGITTYEEIQLHLN